MSKIRANFISSKNDNKAVEFTSGIVVGGAVTATNFDFNAGVYNVGTGASISNPVNNELALGTNNTEKVRITSGGNVGIGLTNPEKLLEVSSSSSPTIRINNSDGSISADQTIGAIEFKANDGSGDGSQVTGSIESISQAAFTGQGSPSHLIFKTNGVSGADALTERLRIKSTGTVAVNNPAYNSNALIQIDAKDNTAYAPPAAYPANQIELQNSVSMGSAIMRFRSQSDNGSAGIWNIGAVPRTSNLVSDFVFQSRTADSTYSEIARFSGDGIVTKPKNPTFGVNRNISSYSQIANTQFTFDRVMHNVGNHYSTATSTFTCPVSGTYQFNFYSIFYQATGAQYLNAAIYAYKNGARFNGGDIHFSSGFSSGRWHNVSYSITVSCALNDAITLHNGPVVVEYHGNNWQLWSGYLVG